MKKLSFLALAAVGLLFGACASNDELDSKAVEDSKDGTGYLAVQIQLPAVPASATRANNDVYDDGLAAEYKVNNAALLLFHGTTEATATFYQAVALTLPSEVTDYDNDNLTSSYLAYSTVNDSYTTNLWALVLVNYTDVFDLGTATFKGKSGSLGADYTVTTSTKIADLQGAIFANDFKKNGFFMTNAVLSSIAGSAESVLATPPSKDGLSVLAKLEDDCIKDSEKEAKLHPAGSIFVERALAKATLKVTATKIGSSSVNVTGAEWALNNTETSSYLVRNMGTLSPDYMGYSSEAFGTTPYYRFAGGVKIGETAIQPTVNYYRTYWCIDPQYGGDATLNTTSVFGATGDDNPQYCYENTFDVAHQTYRNTTRAIIKVETDGGDFYTVNGAPTKYSETDAISYLMDVFINDAGVKKALSDHYTGGPLTIDASYFTLAAGALSVSAETGICTLDASKISLETTTKVTTANKFDVTAAQTAFDAAKVTAAATANTYVDVLKYTSGVMYYEARIQHFANTQYEKTTATPTASGALAAGDLAPWNFWETTKPTVSTAYPANTKTAEENYLGRYGMVRNNWYYIEVPTLDNFGSPVDPSTTITTDPTPDDNVSSKYIAVKINVLSWAKRIQKWSF